MQGTSHAETREHCEKASAASDSNLLAKLIREAGLSRSALTAYLTRNQAYPDKYRAIIWRFMLSTPDNHEAHDLLAREVHPALLDFAEKYPVKPPSLCTAVQGVLSSLANWAVIFAELDYLPKLAFPFILALRSQYLQVTAFEVIATILLNFCQKWFDYYPNPPIEILEYIDIKLKDVDEELHSHLTIFGPVCYAWPLLQTLLSESLTRDDWLTLWDHLLTYSSKLQPQGGQMIAISDADAKTENSQSKGRLTPPALLYETIIIFLHMLRAPIMRLATATHLQQFLCSPHKISMRVFLKRILAAKDKELNLNIDSTGLEASMFRAFLPLPAGSYPLFTEYPVYIVNYAAKLHNLIQMEENAYLRRRRASLGVQKLKQRLDNDQKAWDASEKRLNEMLDGWWKAVLGSETKQQFQREKDFLADQQELSKIADAVSDARSNFMNRTLETTAQRGAVLQDVSRRVNLIHDRKAKYDSEHKVLDNISHDLERKWEALQTARELGEKMEHSRLEALVKQLSKVPREKQR